MEIVEIDNSKKDIFNDFISENNGCFLQSFEWGEFKRSFDYWDVKRFILKDNDEIKAGFSVFIRKIPYINKTFFYIPRGPVIKEQNKELNHNIFETIKKQAKTSRSIFLKIEPEIENIPEGWPDLVENKKHIQPRCTSILDLTKNEDSILSGFESKTRYNIRLGQKKGVEIIKTEEKTDIKKFFSILEETSKRQKFLIHQNNYYEALWDIFKPQKMIHLFMACYKGEPVSGLFLITFGNKCWYLYGASGSIHRETMPNYALHWEVIKWAKNKGLKEYDLWGIPYVKDDDSTPPGNHPLFGVWRFKKGFGGKVVRYPGTFDIPYSQMYYKLFEKGIKTYFKLRNISIRGETKDALQD
ncbi:MAG: peptidoglycan bridge formation glycyltransferase FemA/FemB family protein [bacterium]|nr:peptidoglycan bridge formation glycyltransferase FemA/FemB family protein [bacterium]